MKTLSSTILQYHLRAIDLLYVELVRRGETCGLDSNVFLSFSRFCGGYVNDVTGHTLADCVILINRSFL